MDKEHEFLNAAISQRLKGVIIAPVSQLDTVTKDSLLKLEESGIPVVLIDRDIRGVRFDGVFVDNFGGAYDGVEALIQSGHKKIAVIAGPSTPKPGKERLQGYRQAMEDARDPRAGKNMLSMGDFKSEKAYESTKYLLEQQDPPTAIFSSNNESTLGCLKYSTEKGMAPGREIALLGFDDIETLKVIDYRLSVVERDARQQGMEAGEASHGMFCRHQEPAARKKDPGSVSGHSARIRKEYERKVYVRCTFFFETICNRLHIEGEIFIIKERVL